MYIKEINKQFEEQIECKCKEFGLTYAQTMILLNLYLSGAQNITGLSESMCSVKGNISPICKRLEQNGYLLRCKDERDQRILTVDLTPSARNMIRQKLIQSGETDCPQRCQDEILKGLQLLREYLSDKSNLGEDVKKETK